MMYNRLDNAGVGQTDGLEKNRDTLGADARFN